MNRFPGHEYPRSVPTSTHEVMKLRMIFRWPRLVLILMALASAAFAIIAIRPFREPVLRAAGWALVVNEPVASADIIVLSLDSGSAGALEAGTSCKAASQNELRSLWALRVK